MAEITNMGILTNTPNIYDATSRRIPENTELVFDDKYQGGGAISSTKPGVTIFDTGVIKAGTFAGTYSIGFYYDSSTATVQGTPLMRVEIYEDGVLMPEDTSVYQDTNGEDITLYEYDLNFFNYSYLYGVHITKVFKANATHQIIVKTAETLEDHAVLDYVTLSRHGQDGIINGISPMQTISIRNGGSTRDISTYGTQMVMAVISGKETGLTLASGAMVTHGFTYNTPFKSIVYANPTIYYEGNGQLTTDWKSTDLTNSQILINIRNNSSSSITLTGSTYNIQILVVGYI